MTPPRRPRTVALLLALGAAVVPRRRRAAWRRQWVAEIEHRLRAPAGRRGLGRFAWGAVLHALHLRRREATMTGWMRELAQVARGLLRRPGFSLVAVATLAVGIGAASAVFSLAEAMLLRPVPLPESHELVRVHSTNPERGLGWFSVSVPDFEGIGDTGAFERRSLYRVQERDLAGAGDPLRIRTAEVHREFFETLRTAPVAGRLLGPADQRADADPVAVLSEGLWIRRYGADPAVVGTTIRLDGRAHTVVGVVPDRGAWPAGMDAWVALAWGGAPPDWADVRSNHAWQVVARLADGLSVDDADDRVRAWSRTVYAGAEIDPRDVGTELLTVALHRSESGEDAAP
ncbi:MAG: ABC transporter permease, partial [Longimicrobiales bacterium]